MRYGSRFLVDLRILEENYHKLKKICPDNQVIFMVKADAYGHGLTKVTQFAHENLGVNEFGCATLGEALKLREDLPDLEFEVYVFSDVQLSVSDYSESYLHHRIIPVITRFSDLEVILTKPEFKNFPLCLLFNTGMNRLGFRMDSVDEVISQIKSSGRKEVYHLMSHFACASQPMDSNKRNLAQRENFKAVKEKFVEAGIKLERTSLSNSGAIEQKVGLEETHVRPGLMLYGPTSLLDQYSDKSCWDGKIISSLETYVIDHYTVDKGTPVGYGATPVSKDGELVIVALGYGDGVSTHFSGVEVDHGDKTGKFVGRVNMDMSQLLFPEGTKVEEGERFLLWDSDPKNLKRISEQSKTIPYELFCQLTSRVPRVYTLGQED